MISDLQDSIYLGQLIFIWLFFMFKYLFLSVLRPQNFWSSGYVRKFCSHFLLILRIRKAEEHLILGTHAIRRSSGLVKGRKPDPRDIWSSWFSKIGIVFIQYLMISIFFLNTEGSSPSETLVYAITFLWSRRDLFTFNSWISSSDYNHVFWTVSL